MRRSPTRLLDWLLADRTRADRRWVVAQWPNPALWLFLALTGLGWLVSGGWVLVVYLASRLALLWWGADELLRGVNPFRRALGAGTLVVLVVGVWQRL